MDSYAPCPCGSGKKLKFCCQAILPDLSKIERLQENNQPRQALLQIDKLLKQHPDHAWLITQRAMALFNEARFAEARDTLVPFLHKQPDHPLANVLLATAVSQLDPYPASKKVIHRAFLKSTASEPNLVGLLAGRIAAYHLDEGHIIAARQHMALVLRLGSEQERQQSLMAMLEVDADVSIPYPLRGLQPVPKYTPVETAMPKYRQAMKLATLGCFEEAADALEQVAQLDADAPEAWHTLGLMRAFDGDHARAVAALRQAGQKYQDFETAVAMETLAQLLERELPERTVATRMKAFAVDSLSRLLTRLDNEDRLSRVSVDQEEQQAQVAARYDILDRPHPTDRELDTLTLDSAPRIIGRVGLFDRRGEDQPARAVITAIEGERLDQACQLFASAAGDLAKPSEEILRRAETGELDDLVVEHPQDEIALSDPVFVPAKTPASRRRQLRQDLLNRVVHHTWMNLPQTALAGNSPKQAIGQDSLRVPLAAAAYVIDAFMDGRDQILDLAALRVELQLPALPSYDVTPETDLNAYTTLQLQHLNWRSISDELFPKVMHRVLVTKQCRPGYTVLKELLEHRPEVVEKDPNETLQCYHSLADICSQAMRSEEALEWVEKGFQFAKAHDVSFQSLLFWKMRELSYRAADPTDPQLKDLLLELWNHYGAKVPQVRERLQEVVEVLELEAPWDNAILTAQTGAGGGVVLAAETAESVSTEKKLWLPD